MSEILALMNKGEVNLTDQEVNRLRTLALEAQAYEKSIYAIPAPSTLEGMIELKMYEMKLRQKDLAKTLKVSDTKLSMILSGKQKPDVPFLKALYRDLDIPADFILEHV
ncbi:MAG: helix-turn-helix domain-containing protein [Leadbetterella sp.]|nr:helix-turn-helix domain-containing protein [Leadbetterella sp.]